MSTFDINCPQCHGSGYAPESTRFCTEPGCINRERVERKAMSVFIGADLRGYIPERHDPDSLFFDDSYVGPSERELMGGCNRCGGLDDCYCIG